jgi:CheY-like chemotaxis protein
MPLSVGIMCKDDSDNNQKVLCTPNRILLVDDEESLTNLFEMILSMEIPECEIDKASHGVEALEQFSLGHHVVIVMDLHMPIMDGQTAFEELKKMCDLRNWEMPSVVFCTGYAPPDALKAVFVDSQEHCVLSKPISGDTLAEAVKIRM